MKVGKDIILILFFLVIIHNNLFSDNNSTNNTNEQNNQTSINTQTDENIEINQNQVSKLSFDGYRKREYNFAFNYPWSMYEGGLSVNSALELTIKSIRYPIELLAKDWHVVFKSLVFFAKAFLIDTFFSWGAMTFTHEFIGHGSRFLEAGWGLAGFYVEVPRPYGGGSGWASSYTYEDNRDVILAIGTAGSESNSVRAYLTQIRWLKNGYMTKDDFIPYLLARTELPGYILFYTSQSDFDNQSHDYAGYLTGLNYKYGYNDINNLKFSLNDLKKWAYISLIDPFLYLSGFALFYNLFTNNKDFKIPLIPLGKGAGFMPSSRVAMTPYGPEWYIDVFLRLKNGTIISSYFRMGSKTFKTFWGIGSNITGLKLTDKIEIGGSLDIFYQPKHTVSMDLGAGINEKSSFGFSISLDFHYWFTSYFKILSKIGYKTPGFVFGHPIQNRFMWHVGAGFYF